MVFNSNGKSHVNTFKYKCFILETVESYCYLGSILGIFLMENGRKAAFSLKSQLG